MTELTDTRELVGKTATDHRAEQGLYAAAASSAVFELLNAYPDVELATLQFRVDVDSPPDITITATGRRGPLVDGEPACPSCHVHGNQPHTEYCQAGQPVHTFGPGGDNTPIHLPPMPLPTQPPGETDDTPAWIDDGCRCPTRTNHLDGCPVLDSPLSSFPE